MFAGGKLVTTDFPPRITVTKPLSFIFMLAAIFASTLERFNLNPTYQEAVLNLAHQDTAVTGLLFSIRLSDILVIFALSALLLERRKINLPRFFPWKIYYASILLMLLSTFRAVYIGASFKQILQYAFIFFIQLPLCCILFKELKHFKLGVFAMALGFIMVLVASMYVFFSVGRINEFGMPSLEDNFYGSGGLNRTTFLCVPIFLFLILCIDIKNLLQLWLFRLSLMAALCLSAIFAILTYDRSVLITYPMVIALFVTFVCSKTASLKSLLSDVFFMTLLSAFCLMLLYMFVLPEPVKIKLVRPFLNLANDASSMSRLNSIKALFSSAPTTLLLGWGMGTQNIDVGIRHFISAHTVNPIPHNMFLYWWAGAGFIAMILLILLVLFFYKCLLIVFFSSPKEYSMKILAAVFLSAFTGHLIFHMMHASSLHRTEWFIYGLGLALYDVWRKKAEFKIS